MYNGALQQLQLEGKPFAVFGCGDAVRFPSNFADALAELHHVLCAAGGIPLTSSYTCSSTYLMKRSKSIVNSHALLRQHSVIDSNSSDSSGGRVNADSGSCFVGLPLDCHNQAELTNNRIDKWCGQLVMQLQQEYPDALLPKAAGPDSNGQHQHNLRLQPLPRQAEQHAQQQQQQLEIGDWSAAWPSQGNFHGEYPRGFIFTDRWYCLGDRWYRFADAGFQVRAGFREHVVYTYAYSDIISVEARQQQWEGGHDSQQLVDVWVTLKDKISSSSSSILVLKDVECWHGDSSSTTIAVFLKYQMQIHCQLDQHLVASDVWLRG